MDAAANLDDTKNRRLSKRVANAANGKKHRQEKSKKLKKPLCTVDFAKLEMSSLLKYKRHFKLPLRPSAPKVNKTMTHCSTRVLSLLPSLAPFLPRQ